MKCVQEAKQATRSAALVKRRQATRFVACQHVFRDDLLVEGAVVGNADDNLGLLFLLLATVHVLFYRTVR